MSEYRKIETLYERDETTHRLKPELVLRNPVYGLIKSWHWTEKIDGTNIRCVWNPGLREVTSGQRSGESLSFGGKTDNAQIHADLIRWLYENVTPDKMRAVFPDCPAVIYGEGYGAGIQRGGDYSPTKTFAVFDVLVDGKWWLNWANTADVAGKLGLATVPSLGEMTLESATEMVRAGFRSFVGTCEARAEGLVGRTREPLFDKKGERLIVKLKTKDFAR